MSKPADRPPAISPQIVDDILDEQRRLWSHGERVLVEAYLQRMPLLAADRGVVLDLIYNEIVLREKAGERPAQQEYLQRFPDLAAELTLQFEVDGGLDWQMIADTPAPAETTEPKPAQPPNRGTPFPPIHGYTITGLIGRGATGAVYKARQLSQDRSVAVKVVLACTRSLQEAVAALHAEAEKLVALHHPHLCPIHEVGIDTGRLIIAQERVEGSLLKSLGESTVSPRQAAQWTETLARTVRDIHAQGIMHGNLTPANILMSFNGILKITDIGLARFCDNRQTLDHAHDVYSLGKILFTLLAGRASHSHPIPPLSNVPRDLETICLQCLQSEPGERYASAAALADDLSAFLAGKPIRARRPGILQRAKRSIQNWRSPSRKAGTTADVQGQRRADRVQLTFELACRLMRCTDLAALLRLLAEAAAWMTEAERVTLYIVDRERGEFWAPILSGADVEDWRSPLDAGIAGAVAATKQTVNITDGRADPRVDAKIRNLLALPILNGDGVVIGVMEAVNKARSPFDTEDAETLTNLLTAAAIAIERAG